MSNIKNKCKNNQVDKIIFIDFRALTSRELVNKGIYLIYNTSVCFHILYLQCIRNILKFMCTM